MAPQYIVDYRQVNINTGDCSFVLLVQKEQGKNPVIKRAVMIDGGDGGQIRINNIKRVIERIEEKYNLKKGGLKLDAMVITHWDHDHYYGLLRLLEQDLNQAATTTIGGRKLLEVSFLKYDKGNPQSILYIPYPQIVGTPKIVYSPSPPTGTTGEFGFDTKDGRRMRICKYLADMPEKPQYSILDDKPKVLDSTDESELIGRDLFTNEKPTLAQVVSATNPKALADAHSATMPGLYCVAANNRYLKGEKKSDDLTKGGTSKNRSSIVCMIIREDGTMSHYFAGDAYQDLEAKVIDWTRLKPLELDPATSEPPSVKPTLQERIAIVKASHHGAATSTPITFCQTYKPMFFVFSSGNKHRHPTWEILLYVYSYYASPLGQSISPKDRGGYSIYTTSFPYWIDKIKDEDLVNKEDPLTATTTAADTYRDTIKKFFNASTIGVNLVDKFINKEGMTKETPLKERGAWIRRHVQNIVLMNFSPINDPKFKFLPSTSKDEDELKSRVSSIVFTSDNDRHSVDVNWIGVSVVSMPPAQNRSKSSTRFPDMPVRKKFKV